jgi:hypothetical protein
MVERVIRVFKLHDGIDKARYLDSNEIEPGLCWQ